MKIVEHITLHVSDDTGRITMLENRTFSTQANDNNTAPSLKRYIYSNHLQSASLELDENSLIISYEEHHPYGTTSYQAMNATILAVAKRYRYTGKERDEESGLYYHGARYYIPWLCRWSASDPLESKYAGMSPYNYSFNNPVMFNDPSGADPGDEEEKLPKAVRNGGVAGGFTAGNENSSSTNSIVLDEVVIEGKKVSKPWYSSLGFDSDGYYRNEYSDDDFSDPGNYVKFLDNAAGSIWNFGAKFVNDLRYGTWEGTKREFSETFGYYFKTDFSQQIEDTKTQFKAAFSDIKFYENIAGALITGNASRFSTSAVNLSANIEKNINSTMNSLSRSTLIQPLKSAVQDAELSTRAFDVLKTDEVYFMQKSMNNTTGGYTVLENAKALKSGTLNPDVLRINVWKDEAGKIWTLDHRRLGAFKLSGLQEVPVQWAYPTGQMFKMTTINGGTSIQLKFPGGNWTTVK